MGFTSVASPHKECVSSLALNMDETLLCSTSLDSTIALFDTSTIQCVTCFKGHKDAINHVLFLSALNDCFSFVTASDDRTVLRWDSRSPSIPVSIFSNFSDGINKVSFSPSGHFFASAADDGKVYMHSVGDGKLVDSFFASSSTVNDVIVLPTCIVTSGEDCSVRYWSPQVQRVVDEEGNEQEERLLESLDMFENPVNHIAFYGGRLYAACSECLISIEVDPTTAIAKQGEESNVGIFAKHQDYIRGIGFGGGVMVTVSDDGTAVEWDPLNANCLRSSKIHDDCVMAMELAARSDSLISGCNDSSIRIWSLPLSSK